MLSTQPNTTTRGDAADSSDRISRLRAEFPALSESVNGHSLVYLDNAATSQKPRSVIERLRAYYEHENSNVHRGVHALSQSATEAYESARRTVAGFINAADACEIVFTRGTTEAINLVARSFGQPRLQKGDEILVTLLEHHSNIVPWQLVAEATGAELRVVPIDGRGCLQLDSYTTLLGDRTRIVALSHISNALGTVNPIRRMIAEAHERDIPVLIDGAQAVPHRRVDVQYLDCDFYAFSGHKMFGPTGIGVLYGKEAILDEMPPWQGGGDMIEHVSFAGTTYADLPHKFEAGTPHIAGAIGLGAAIEFLNRLDHEFIESHESFVLSYALERLAELDGMHFIGSAPERTGVISMLLGNAHPYDVGAILDRLGIAVRTGHHCAEPLMDHLGIPGTVRASFAFYNTTEEVDRLCSGLQKAASMLL